MKKCIIKVAEGRYLSQKQHWHTTDKDMAREFQSRAQAKRIIKAINKSARKYPEYEIEVIEE